MLQAYTGCSYSKTQDIGEWALMGAVRESGGATGTVPEVQGSMTGSCVKHMPITGQQLLRHGAVGAL